MELRNVSVIQPGMRLARAVFTRGGEVLALSGALLDEELLQKLRQWGIGSVFIEQPDTQPVPAREGARPEDMMRSLRLMVAERFGRMDLDNPYAQAVFELAVERQGRLLLSGPGKVALGKGPSPAFQTPRPGQVSLKSLIAAGHCMGTLPLVFQRLVDVLNNSNSSIDEIARVITADPALTAKLLRLVNSPFYGLPGKIDTIPRAVVMVGTRQLVMLAMGAILVTAFKGLPISLVNMQSFWSHCISTGIAARLLARQMEASQAESFFVAGLLHDIARLLIYSQLPQHALYMLTEAKRRREPVYVLEKETLGFTHDTLGRELLHVWRCPAELERRVAEHHRQPRQDDSQEDTILPVADRLTQALGYGSSGEYMLLPLPDHAWEKLGLTPEEVVDLCRKLDDNVRHLRALFTADS